MDTCLNFIDKGLNPIELLQESNILLQNALVFDSEIQKMDTMALALQSSTDLMFNAGFACFKAIKNNLIFASSGKILILCGKGNNGGDGFVLAHLFAENKNSVAIYCVEKQSNTVSKEALFWYTKAKENKDIYFIETLADLKNQAIKADILIDAVYGIGFHGELKEEIQEIFKITSLCKGKKIAIDIPSGLSCNNGNVSKWSFKADLTLTFEFLKPALVSAPKYAGEIKVLPIGFTQEIRSKVENSKRYFLTQSLFTRYLETRMYDIHKGSLGKLLLVCGSRNMTGAAYFSAMGALKSGIGLLYIACEEEILPVLEMKLNEPVFLPFNKDVAIASFKASVGNLNQYKAIVHGCGWGNEKQGKEITNYLIENSPHILVLDADGINNLAEDLSLLHKKKCKLIVTPHLGEMARLIKKDIAYVEQNRIQVALDFAQAYDCFVVLKGPRTLIATPENVFSINSSGNGGMAKGGMGDILAGIIGTLVSQEVDIYEALCAAVYFHGKAGDFCEEKYGQRSMLPTQVLDLLFQK